MLGLAPLNIRQTPSGVDVTDGPGIDVDVSDQSPSVSGTPILEIEHDDGSITVSLDGKSLVESEESQNPPGWFANLADLIDDMVRGQIADELLRGIDDDLSSRKDWIEQRAQGIRLLGLTIELPGLQGAADGAPVEGMSKVRHPLLLEAVLRFQANARSELLPTDGPVKVRDDHNGNPPSWVGSALEQDQTADALEADLNHYLTAVATEYYPDTDRMLLKTGFGGTGFKKGYQCPLRGRPVLESVDADDLIVNNAATDLNNARRITHRIYMRPSVVKRMQLLDVYRDIDLSTPVEADLDAAQRAEKDQQGVSAGTMNPDDRDRTIYECYCELDIPGFEHKKNGKATGLEIPFRVTLDLTTREILSIVRDYDEETKRFPERRVTFIKFPFVPGFGFYDIGLLHILGNTTNAITAAWREMLDNGMYANFPGFIVSKQATRQNTNVFRVPPGGAAQIDSGNLKLSDAVMAMPYNTQHMAPLMALVQNMEQTAQRVGGTAELQVGEGKSDAPVGTTLALIDQATKVMNAVHKRLHAAQAEEFKLLVTLLREHPEAITEARNLPSGQSWTEQTFLKALHDHDLVPQADPNTASHTQRVMKIMGLKQLQAASPNLYNPIAIDTAALQAMGWSNPEQFFQPPAAQAAPPPELQQMQANIAAESTVAKAKMIEAQSKSAQAQAKIEESKAKAAEQTNNQGPSQTEVMKAKADLMDAETNKQGLALKAAELHTEDQNRDQDRAAKMHTEILGLAKDVMLHPGGLQPAVSEAKGAEREIGDQ